MLRSQTILNALPHVLKTLDIPELGKKAQGKVRTIYVKDDKRILIATDSKSAFDVVLGYAPFTGAVLTQLAKFWFEKTEKIIPNHMLSTPDPNVMIVKNCQPLPVEMVVRGYMSGVTKTSIWYSYQKGERNMYGLTLPDGLSKNQKLPHPIITPTTHPEAGSGKHDERLTRDKIINNKIIDEKVYEQMEKISLELFDFGSKWSQKHGLILVDTKYEFGLYNGELILIDEIHTPDSSRFWRADTYMERLGKGLEPENFDKEFFRLWYAERGYTGDGNPPKMPKELVVEISKRYVTIFETLTGKQFKPFNYPIESRIKQNLKKVGLY
jgi:phosphoribosylaminoimidazole-succinocarboxamide synthase